MSTSSERSVTSSVIPTVKRRFGLSRCELGEHSRGHRRRELLGRESVAAADHPGQLAASLRERRHDVLEERFRRRCGILRSIEHSDRANGGRERGDKGIRVEGPVQPHLDEPYGLARFAEPLDRLLRGADARSHEHEDALGLRIADVLEETVAAPCPLAEPRHLLLHDLRHRRVVRVGRLARLEEDVRVLRAAAKHRVVGRERAGAVGGDELGVEERAYVVLGEAIDRVELVRRSEPVEEVEEGDSRAQGRGVSNQCEVLRLLDGGGAEEREARRSGRHHVGVVAEDRERVGRDRPRRDVEHRRGELSGDLEHVREHEQEPLGGRERRRECSRLERPVDGARGAALALHLHDLRDHAPRIRDAS